MSGENPHKGNFIKDRYMESIPLQVNPEKKAALLMKQPFKRFRFNYN